MKLTLLVKYAQYWYVRSVALTWEKVNAGREKTKENTGKNSPGH